MEITEVIYPITRSALRAWLEANQASKTEAWVRTFKKASGQPSITYDEMVEECLCFGWIDGVVQKFDEDSKVQRITPRRKKTFLSELNRQRIWKLQRLNLMTQAGIDPIFDQIGAPDDPFEIPNWVLEQLQSNQLVWENFQSFPVHYQRLKIGWITEIRGSSRREEAQKRLDYLLKMTLQNKMYGSVP